MAPRFEEGSDTAVVGDNDRVLGNADISGWGVEGIRSAGARS
jgi:hypothetical protein